MKKKKIILILLMIFYIQFSFCSCLDKKEINELAVVNGLAVDTADNFGDIKVTVNITNFSQSKNDSNSNFVGVHNEILTATGKNLLEAIDKIENISSKRIILSHNKILILGKAYAENGISSIMDSIERNHFFRSTIYIAVSDTTGYDVLKTSVLPNLSKASSLSQFVKMLSSKTIVYPRQWYSFLLNIKSDSGAATAPLIKISDNGLMIENSVIFKNEKMVGILSPKQATTLQWLLNNIKDMLITIPYNDNTSSASTVSLYFYKGKSEIMPIKIKDGFKVNIKCTGTCEIRGSTSPTFKPNNPIVLREIQGSAEYCLKKDISELINFAQHSVNTDFIGFVNNILNNLNASDKNINWDKEFPNIQYNIDFHVKVKEIGIIKNSIQK